MPCEFVIHGLSKWIWSTYIQGKIKKEAAIACAASAIRVCALITHPPYFDTFERVQWPANNKLKTVQD